MHHGGQPSWHWARPPPRRSSPRPQLARALRGAPSNTGPTPANPSPLNPIPANPPPANPPPPVTPRSTQGVGGSRLTVHMTGPDRRKLGDEAQFVTTVTNAGDVPLKNVVVSSVAETSLEVAGAEMGFEIRGGAPFGRSIRWPLARRNRSGSIVTASKRRRGRATASA